MVHDVLPFGTIKLIGDVTSTQADRGVNEEGCNRSYSHNNPVAKWAEEQDKMVTASCSRFGFELVQTIEYSNSTSRRYVWPIARPDIDSAHTMRYHTVGH
jgi:hypothetical protein